MSRRTTLTGVAALALAVSGSAAAADRPDDRAGPLGVGGVAIERTGGTAADVAARPDDRAAARGPGAVGLIASAPATAAVVEASSGFDWADAAIGAAGGIAAVLLAGGLAVAGTRVRHRGHATA